MKKILVIKNGLKIGGTTSSFLSFLRAICKNSNYQINAYIYGASKEERENIPEEIVQVKNEALDRAFSNPSGIKKFFYLIKNNLFFPYLAYKFFGRKWSRNKTIKTFQKMDIRKAAAQKQIDLSEYDAVITWEELYPCYLLAKKIVAKKKIAWIHPDYENCGFWVKYDLPIFKKLDAVVAVSSGGKESLQRCFPHEKDKFFAVDNCIDIDTIIKKSQEKQTEIAKNGFTIITVARLQNISKAMDRAIRITEKLKKEGLKFQWYWIGGGPDQEETALLIKNAQLTQEFILLGEKDNPYKYVKQADLFVLQSYYEGRPVVVDEAIALGVPVLVSEYASARIQVKEKYGMVAKNEENDIYLALKTLIENPSSLQEYRKNLLRADCSLDGAQQCLELFNKVI